jgi:flagellar protein FliL
MAGSKMARQKKNDGNMRAPSDSHGSSVSGPLIVLLIIAMAGGTLYFFIKHGPISDPDLNTRPYDSAEESTYAGPLVDIGEFIVNIISEEQNHYLKAAMTIEAADPKSAEELKRRMPQIRDAVLMLVSNKTFEELYDMHGKKQLKAELLLEINAILTNGEAAAIYFTEFVVQ